MDHIPKVCRIQVVISCQLNLSLCNPLIIQLKYQWLVVRMIMISYNSYNESPTHQRRKEMSPDLSEFPVACDSSKKGFRSHTGPWDIACSCLPGFVRQWKLKYYTNVYNIRSLPARGVFLRSRKIINAPPPPPCACRPSSSQCRKRTFVVLLFESYPFRTDSPLYTPHRFVEWVSTFKGWRRGRANIFSRSRYHVSRVSMRRSKLWRVERKRQGFAREQAVGL